MFARNQKKVIFKNYNYFIYIKQKSEVFKNYKSRQKRMVFKN